MTESRIPIAILGATGAVGQKAVALLQDHQKFTVAQLVASEAKAGHCYGDVVEWREATPLQQSVARIPICSLHAVDSPFAISALPASIAREEEARLAERGIHIFSNASSWRMDPTVPLVIPEVNIDSLSLLEQQPHPGKIVTNSNCVVAVLAPVLAAVLPITSLRHVGVTTLQALSGAGYQGMETLNAIGNVIPHIEGEAEKIVAETRKILGAPTLPMTVQVHRVPVQHGHTVAIQLHFHTAVHADEVREAIAKQVTLYPETYVTYDEPASPQPVPCLTETDMRIHIGGIRQGGDNDTVAITALGHNLVRGAAGAAIANMEAAITEGAVRWQENAYI